ncbi:MAG: peptidoglycan recognition family protein [Phycisphaerae bacterium]|jgi:N-acetyl-anhydromuramyl-L-alanine amidase AmpD
MKPIVSRTLLMLVMLAWAGGCNSAAAPLAALPTHDLDLSGGVAKPACTMPAGETSQPSVAAPEDDWACQGYRQWRYIVIHHSGNEKGNAAEFDLMHRRRGWDELGYHFVIDNGQGGRDGAIEVGSRWKSQKWGAHCGGTPNNEYNTQGIGICLVGDFSNHMPSQAQLESLCRLVSYLAATCEIEPENIVGHRDAPRARTECPGDVLLGYVHTSLRDLGYGRSAAAASTLKTP